MVLPSSRRREVTAHRPFVVQTRRSWSPAVSGFFAAYALEGATFVAGSFLALEAEHFIIHIPSPFGLRF